MFTLQIKRLQVKRLQIKRPAAARGWVLGIEARKCRGLSTEWVVSGASLPLEIQTLWEFDWTPVGRARSGHRRVPVDRH